jgi:hypothetical protein
LNAHLNRMNALLKISVGTVTFDDREWSSYQDLEI